MKPRISFIVPVLNDAGRLATCLASIHRNGSVPGQIEIIVVDNGSTDGSGDVARRNGARDLTVLHGRVSALRNRGAEEAAADVLAFIDADNEIGGGWVYAALVNLQAPNVAAAGALCQAPENGTWVQRAYGYLRGGPSGQQDVDWLGSGNLAVERAAFKTIGGFDTSLETCEDVEMCHRLRARGFRVISDARMKNVHHGDPLTLRDVLTSERWRGRDNLRVSFRRPIAWASIPSAVVPVLHAVLIVAMVLGVLTAVKAGWLGGSLAVTAAALFASPAIARVVRAAARAGRKRTVSFLQAFVVACVWDVGRTLAILSKASHRAAPPEMSGTAS
jgi:glycosyltransferase involved in cell wall biosynthesis